MANRPPSDRARKLAEAAEAENNARREACKRLQQWHDALEQAYFDSVPANDCDKHEAAIWFGKHLQMLFVLHMIQCDGVGNCEWALRGAAEMLWRSTIAFADMRRGPRNPQTLLGQVSK